MKKRYIPLVSLLLFLGLIVVMGFEGGWKGSLIDNTAYDATTWDDNLDGATKNAIRDKIETMGSGDAPKDAKYIVQQLNGTLTAEQATGALATGIVKNTTTTGVLSIAVANTDYEPALTNEASLYSTLSDVTDFVQPSECPIDSDFGSNGLMERTGAGTYDTASASDIAGHLTWSTNITDTTGTITVDDAFLTNNAADSMVSATPQITLDDSDGADGFWAVNANDADDAVLTMGVDDSNGDDQVYLTLDGVNEKVTIAKELEITGELDANGVVTLGDGGDNFSVASDGIDISTGGVITNATFDANATENVLKKYEYLQLINPHLAGAGLTAGMDTTNTNEYYGQVKFANNADEATNYCEYRLVVPHDIDTSVDLTAVFHFRLGGADTADQDYVISHDTVAASADYTGTLTNAVNLDYTADGSGADGDHEQTAETTLTDWKSNLTAGNLWVIRVARDGDDGTNDASTVDSYSSVLVIKYGVTQ